MWVGRKAPLMQEKAALIPGTLQTVAPARWLQCSVPAPRTGTARGEHRLGHA